MALTSASGHRRMHLLHLGEFKSRWRFVGNALIQYLTHAFEGAPPPGKNGGLADRSVSLGVEGDEVPPRLGGRGGGDAPDRNGTLFV